MMNQATIALAGNPNAGKSTIFNALTGEHQHVGNWPGKTVERKEGEFSINGVTMNIIDLPGTYSLTAYSMEEKITRDFLLQNQPDAVVAVVDAANLERNLYLVVQMLELGVPIVIALNMADMAESRGLKIDTDQLAAGLNVPIIRTIATRNEGLEELKQTVAQAIQNCTHRPARSRTGDATKHDAPRCPNCG
jgi:ferrous iron transport protein B